MQYHVFDIVNSFTQMIRITQVYHLCFNPRQQPNILAVETQQSNNVEGSMDYWLSQGYEGIIIRHHDGLYQPCHEKARSDYLMKLKPRKLGVFPIIGKLEEESIFKEPKDALGAFLCSHEGQRFKVGTGFTRADRERFWENEFKCRNYLAEILYQELSERGVPIFPVFKRLVAKE